MRKIKVAAGTIAIMLLLSAVTMFAMACDESDKEISEDILRQFDISDEQEFWQDGGKGFYDDRVRVVFKKTNTYPELSVDDLPFDNALKIDYVDLHPNDELTKLNADYSKNFRQIADIYLKQTGEDKVLEAVVCLEKLPIFKLVSASLYHLDPPWGDIEQSDELISVEGVSMQFDVTERKVFWSGSVEDEFKDDRLTVVFKRTYTYPVLDVEDFLFSNADSIEYTSAAPVGDIQTFSVKYIVFNYRQTAYIYLKETGKDKVLEAVEHFQKLDFVECAAPDFIQHPQDDGAAAT